MTRRKKRPEKTTSGPTIAELVAAIPDAVAVTNDTGEVIGWDATAPHEYLIENGLGSQCDDDCADRAHIELW